MKTFKLLKGKELKGTLDEGSYELMMELHKNTDNMLHQACYPIIILIENYIKKNPENAKFTTAISVIFTHLICINAYFFAEINFFAKMSNAPEQSAEHLNDILKKGMDGIVKDTEFLERLKALVLEFREDNDTEEEHGSGRQEDTIHL
jgi:hypothetical protein